MINYIIQVLLFQVLFLAVYDFFLQKETFFKWNRFYLMGTPVLSFIIPLLKFESITETLPQEYIVLLPEVVLNPQAVIEQTTNSVATLNYLNLAFYIGLGIFSILFLVKLYKLIKLIISNKVEKKENYNLILLENKQSAFSFFNYIFIDKTLAEKEELKIIQHELVHCKHLHSVDLLFFEFFKIVMWFNPLVYVYQKRITLLHEYISDAETVKTTDKKQYFNTLLAETFNVENISFVNQFYKHSLIKKRIVMITKNKSQKLKQLKYLVLIPLLGGMLLYSSCETNEETLNIEAVIAKKEIITIYRVREGELRIMKGNVETYLDVYVSFGATEILLEGKDVNVEDLLHEEKLEYEETIQTFKLDSKDVKIFQIANGRKVIIQRINLAINNNKEDYKDKEDVPFAIVDKTPTFTDCEGTKEELKDCLNKGIQQHVAINFNSEITKNLGLSSGIKKIYVQFKILKNGAVEILGARAPHQDLEEEARRVVNSLPKMIPGEHNGKPVNVTYMLPISFNVEGVDDENTISENDLEASNQNVYMSKTDRDNNDIDYYVNGKQVAKIEFEKLRPEDISKINVIKSKDGNRDKMEITLKE